MKKVALLFAVIFTIASCSSEHSTVEAPVDLIPIDSFAYLVGEMQIVHVVNRQTGHLEQLDSLKSDVYFEQACAKFDVSVDRYERSYAYYLEQIDTMEVVFEKALIYLEQKDTEVKTAVLKED